MSVYNMSGSAISSLYNKGGASIGTAFDKDENCVFGIYGNYTISTLRNIDVANCQGIAIHDDVLFQFRASGNSVLDTVSLFDLSDGSTIYRNMTIDSDHGDSASFSNIYYEQNDEFPLIYVTADITPAVIYVNRVTRSAATLIRTLTFPQSAGYYGAGAFDFENNICYLLAYKKNNYQTDDSGTNTTVVSKWDLSNLTDNGNGTYTPAFISQYEREFIYVMQGLAFHDGLIWICSGYLGGATSHIYGMIPDTGVIAYTITMDDTTEIEGIDFVYDSTTQSYYMVTGQQGGKYKKITFGS